MSLARESATSDQPQLSDSTVITEPATAGEHNTHFCPECGHQNLGDRQTCLICTGPLGASCPTCQLPVASGTKFCGQCGTRLDDSKSSPNGPVVEITPELSNQTPFALAEKITSAAVKTSGERREVTVLFVDVTNYTAAAHNLDSEDVYEFINTAMSTLVEVVRQYGGTIDKYTGDGLMALFGAPVAHQNDPYRQGLALLELGRLYQALAQPGNSADPDWSAQAASSLAEAAETFEALGAEHNLQLAQVALNELGAKA